MKQIVLTIAALTLAGAAQASEPAPQHAQGFTPPPAKEGYSYPDCYCTDSAGERIEIGQSVCLEIGSRQVWARCSMSLNNPAWRHETEGCPSV